jgi:hypothetical protein
MQASSAAINRIINAHRVGIMLAAVHHAVADGADAALQVVGFQFFQQRFYGAGVVFRRPETFAKPDICRTRVGGCPVQSSALLVSHFSENE